MDLDIKQLDLNYLFQFDLLKQILVSLSKNQDNLNQELNKINESNKIRDERITRLENSFNLESINQEEQLINSTHSELEKTEKNENENLNKNEENINENNKEKITNDENINKEEDNINKENQNEIINKENIADNNENNNKEKDIDKDEKNNKNINENIQQSNIVSSEEPNNIKNIENKSENIKIINKTNIINDRKMNKKFSNFDNKNIPNDVFLTMMKGNREQKEKMNNLENKFMSELETQIKKIKDYFKKQIKDLNQENKSLYDKLDEEINNLSQKNMEQDEKLEDCILKCNNFDIFNAIKDSGDGSVDLAKLLVKALEEKVFKKFEFIDQRYKQESMELIKISKMSENINIKMDKIERNFNEIRESEIGQIKEDIEKNKNNSLQKIEELNKLLNDKEINLVQKINDLETNILKLLEEKDTNLNKRYQEIENQKNEKPKVDEEELNYYKKKSNIEEDALETLERRVNNLNNKVNNIDSSLKYIMKDWNIEILKKDINEMKFDLEKKITKDNLKELYNLHMSDLDEINDLREHTSALYEDLKKTIKNVSVLAPKVESLTGNILSLKQMNKNLKAPQIDTSKFIDNIKFNEGINQVLKKIENIFREIDSMRRDYYDIKDDQKDYEKKERIMRMEEDIYKKLDEIKLKLQRNKNETNKIAKGFELEIKSIWNEFKKKEQADSWILAKQPMKCFNCATCDNNIKKQIVSEEKIPWNKYPQNEKNYRLGKGFSHMLEMMTYEFIKNLDENKENKEYQPISDENNLNSSNISSNNNNNEENNIDENKNNCMNNIAQIERSSSTPKLNNKIVKEGRALLSINSGRVRLPQVYDITKKKIKIENFKNINSYSSQEKKDDNEANKNEKLKRNNSPQILKITKKYSNNNPIFSPTSSSKRKINADLNI